VGERSPSEAIQEQLPPAKLTSSGAINGGEIQVEASTEITAEQINSSGALNQAGNVTLKSIGDIQVPWINAQGGALGGTVNITTEDFSGQQALSQTATTL
jgi:hypothetical protein